MVTFCTTRMLTSAVLIVLVWLTAIRLVILHRLFAFMSSELTKRTPGGYKNAAQVNIADQWDEVNPGLSLNAWDAV